MTRIDKDRHRHAPTSMIEKICAGVAFSASKFGHKYLYSKRSVRLQRGMQTENLATDSDCKHSRLTAQITQHTALEPNLSRY
jgi:hypothetical protein